MPIFGYFDIGGMDLALVDHLDRDRVRVVDPSSALPLDGDESGRTEHRQVLQRDVPLRSYESRPQDVEERYRCDPLASDEEPGFGTHVAAIRKRSDSRRS